MRYNVYKLKCNGQLWVVCEETEQLARIACAHANKVTVKWTSSCEKIGETDHPYMKRIEKPEDFKFLNTDYPKKIVFEYCDKKGFTPDAQEFISRLEKEIVITMLAENVIRIDYPSDLIKQVRTVNVDDTIFRLDFIDKAERFLICGCVFPNVPWGRKFMQTRWGHGKRTETPGSLTIEYPANDCVLNQN